MENLNNDALGFEQFKIDEQLSSLLSQILGGYARLAFKARQQVYNNPRIFEFQHRFDEIGKIKSKIKHYSYQQKAEEIQKFQAELKDVLLKERSL